MQVLTYKQTVVKWKFPNMPWETVLVSCTHLVKFLFYPHFSTVNHVFEGTFLPHHLRLCPARLPIWSKQEKIISFLPTKVLACCHLSQIHTGIYIVMFCSVHCTGSYFIYVLKMEDAWNLWLKSIICSSFTNFVFEILLAQKKLFLLLSLLLCLKSWYKSK